MYKNELEKASFYHHIVHGNFKDFNRRTTSDEVLGVKAFSIAAKITI